MKNSNTIDNSVVKNVYINKYMGRWYEIARFPHSFEKDLVGVTATYKLLDNNRIEVLNQGYDKTLEGKLKIAKGKAKIPNPEEPGKLKVSFFLFFYADYFILELDSTDYQYALVGSSSENYLWILSRTPQMNPETYNMLVGRAKARGYDVNKLGLVLQKVTE
ncbi:MAG: lipocalin family protein [Bacteroidales bacterium]|nr:lipocalin family protein [Bacteroidales bacterium]